MTDRSGGGPSGTPPAPPFRIAVLARTLWPGSFARIAIEETAGLSARPGVSAEAIVFSVVESAYGYADLIRERGARVSLARCPRWLRSASRALLKPFTPWIRDAESVVPAFEMIWWALFDPERFDVLYCEDQFAALAALLRHHLRRTPYALFLAEPISHAAGIEGLRVVRGPITARWVRWAVRRFERAALDRAESVEYVSARTRSAIQAEFPELAAKAGVALYPGCHPDPRGPMRPDRSSYFVAASKWDAGRHPEVALEIVRRAPVRIVLAGSWVHDRARQAFQEECEAVRGELRGTLVVTGPLSEEELRQTYRDAYAYLHWNPEGFGMGVLEAMAAGVPPVCVSEAGASELLLDEENGLLVRAADLEGFAAAVRRLTEDVTLRNRLAEGAWRTASVHDWAGHVDRLLGVLRGPSGASGPGEGAPPDAPTPPRDRRG